jgi:E3 SUMO-protein ligase RanBP2
MTTPQPSARLAALLRLLETRPDDPRAHFGLALEYESAGQWSDAVTHLERYLELARDEGNAYGRLGSALRRLGRDDEARAAYRQGIDAAYRHGHPSMAADFEEVLDEWDA